MFFLGLFLGVILAMFGSLYWGYRLSEKEDKLTKQLISEMSDRAVATYEERFGKRYES